jgi:class 3 adenylate cyclase
VNVGSRLESLTKDHHRRTLLSGATAALVGDSVPLVALGTATVRGRQEPLALFGIEGEAA